MNACALPMGVSALATAIAGHFPNDAELALVAAVFTQLGDTLGTILAQRALCPPTPCQTTANGKGVGGGGEPPTLVN